jgi:hypothetical protein
MDPIQIHVGASPTSNVLYQTLDAVKSGQGLARTFPVSDALHQCLGVVKNGQEFLHFDGRVRVKKLVQDNRICIGTWNVGSLTRRLIEITYTTVCLQKIKWVSEKSSETEHIG